MECDGLSKTQNQIIENQSIYCYLLPSYIRFALHPWLFHSLCLKKRLENIFSLFMSRLFSIALALFLLFCSSSFVLRPIFTYSTFFPNRRSANANISPLRLSLSESFTFFLRCHQMIFHTPRLFDQHRSASLPFDFFHKFVASTSHCRIAHVKILLKQQVNLLHYAKNEISFRLFFSFYRCQQLRGRNIVCCFFRVAFSN